MKRAMNEETAARKTVTRTLVIVNCILSNQPPTTPPTLYTISCYGDEWSATPEPVHGSVPQSTNLPFQSDTIMRWEECDLMDARGSLVVVGGLCSPHLHIDKCHLLGCCELVDGSFGEALTGTAKAKAAFTEEDLLQRGRRLIRESVSHGVTIIRAHVEVDPTVGEKALRAGIALKEEFKDVCDIRLVLFAQDPLFYPSNPSLQDSMTSLFFRPYPGVKPFAAIGSAPYVESDRPNALANIRCVLTEASRHLVDVDFHLDYDLDPKRQPLIWDVLTIAADPEYVWQVEGRPRRITIGHATHLSLFSPLEITRLKEACDKAGDVFFVALPNSDMYMQGRDAPYGVRSRATFPALELTSAGINCAVGVNNVANLFTPQGDADPLALLPMLIGVWQSAKPADLTTLLNMVSTKAVLSAGGTTVAPGALKGDVASFTVLDGCTSLAQAALAPPYGRTTVCKGKIVSRRTVSSWVQGAGDRPDFVSVERRNK